MILAPLLKHFTVESNRAFGPVIKITIYLDQRSGGCLLLKEWGVLERLQRNLVRKA